jgi:hypothetical protein
LASSLTGSLIVREYLRTIERDWGGAVHQVEQNPHSISFRLLANTREFSGSSVERAVGDLDGLPDMQSRRDNRVDNAIRWALAPEFLDRHGRAMSRASEHISDHGAHASEAFGGPESIDRLDEQIPWEQDSYHFLTIVQTDFMLWEPGGKSTFLDWAESGAFLGWGRLNAKPWRAGNAAARRKSLRHGRRRTWIWPVALILENVNSHCYADNSPTKKRPPKGGLSLVAAKRPVWRCAWMFGASTETVPQRVPRHCAASQPVEAVRAYRWRYIRLFALISELELRGWCVPAAALGELVGLASLGWGGWGYGLSDPPPRGFTGLTD